MLLLTDRQTLVIEHPALLKYIRIMIYHKFIVNVYKRENHPPKTIKENLMRTFKKLHFK